MRFAHRLALHSGVKEWIQDVGRLLDDIGWRQFRTWMDYHELEPFGGHQEDLRAGTLASLLANANRDRKKRARPYSPSDFFPSIKRANREDSGPRQPLKGMQGSWGRFKAALMNERPESVSGKDPFWDVGEN